LLVSQNPQQPATPRPLVELKDVIDLLGVVARVPVVDRLDPHAGAGGPDIHFLDQADQPPHVGARVGDDDQATRIVDGDIAFLALELGQQVRDFRGAHAFQPI
jgi:hypothetical protein